MILFNAVQGVLSIILMISIGYVLSHKGWFDDKSSKLISRLVVNLALPSYMISNLVSTYSREKLLQLGTGLAIPFLAMFISYLLASVIARVFKLSSSRMGTFCSMFALSNTIFVGLPVNLALFGESSLPFVLLYYIANTTLFWTIGVYGISRDGGYTDSKIFNLNTVKRIFSPPLTGFLIAILIVLLKISLPGSVLDTCKYMGSLTTPLSMLFIGIVMHSVNIKEIKIDTSMLVLLAGRFVLAPLIVLGMTYIMPLPVLMKKVFVIQSAMPAMTQTSIIAENYNADYKYAAVMTTITTIASLAVIPFYMVLLSYM